jgi:hypothetical protein
MMDLSHTFGMSEMEDAAGVIIAKAIAAGTWLVATVYQDMKTDNQQAGFIQLIYRKWLQAGYHKRPFYVNQAFIDRVTERHEDLINALSKHAPTYSEITYSQVPLGDPPGRDGEHHDTDNNDAETLRIARSKREAEEGMARTGARYWVTPRFMPLNLKKGDVLNTTSLVKFYEPSCTCTTEITLQPAVDYVIRGFSYAGLGFPCWHLEHNNDSTKIGTTIGEETLAKLLVEGKVVIVRTGADENYRPPSASDATIEGKER